jgi:uncharacterized coiled-coil DUF342 family protein
MSHFIYMSNVQGKIDELNSRITKLTSANRSIQGNVRVRVDKIKTSLGSLIERVKSLNVGAGKAREELENMRKSNDELRLKIDGLTKDNDDLQRVIDNNNIPKIESELEASIKTLDTILSNMEGDDSISDSLKALEDEIEGLEKTIGEKEANTKDGDNNDQAGGKRRRRKTRKKSRKRKHSGKRKTRK